MNKIEAKNLVKSTFESNFDEYTYKNFINNLFQNINFKETNLIVKNQYEDYISDALKIGKCELTGNTIELLIIKTKKVKSLYNAKTMQRNFIANYVNQTSSYGAIVAFVSPNNESWRFSFVKVNYKYDSVENKLKKEISSAKRWSFLAGNKEKSNTLQNNIVPLLEKQNFSITEFENAFSIEPVTKEFYAEYKKIFDKFNEYSYKNHINLQHIVQFEDKEKAIRDFNKKLLGRMVFIYFLQKKLWMNNDENYLYNLYLKCKSNDGIFYNQYLEILFYEVLNKPKKNIGDSSVGADLHIRPKETHDDSPVETRQCLVFTNDFDNIPFLNGGLFEKEYEGTIFYPNDLFENVFELFNQYNFTIDENDSENIEIAIDPEMLGHIFENLLEDNKDKGAFYTPKVIVDYMTKTSLIEYLKNNFEEKYHEILEEIVNYPDELFARKSFIAENKNKIFYLLDKVKILDPAIGSGAFPVSILLNILKIKETLNPNLNRAEEKKKIIENSIYGVDIEQGAVDIAKLRFWLSLIIDEEQPIPLPNLDYKIVCGDSLLTKFENEVIDIDLKNLSNSGFKSKLENEIFPELKELLHDFFNKTEHKNELKSKIKNLKIEIIETFVKDKIETLNKSINKLKSNLFGISKKEKADLDLKSVEKLNYENILNKLENIKNNDKPLHFFDYNIDFYDVFNPHKSIETKETGEKNLAPTNKSGNINKISQDDSFVGADSHIRPSLESNNISGGFDIVIGNPPYVGEKSHKEIFRQIREGNLKEYYQGKQDLFYFFFHLGLNLLKNNGILSFITTNYFITATGGKKLREDFFKRAVFRKIINFNELKIFESALGQHNMITILQKSVDKNIEAEVFSIKRTSFAPSDLVNLILNKSDTETDYYLINNNNIFDGNEYYLRLQNTSSINNSINIILNKIQDKSILLDEICNVNQGIVSGCDKVTNKHIEKHSLGVNIGDGIFVLSDEQIKLLNLNENDKKILKPWFKNSDVLKWVTNEISFEKIIYADKNLQNLKNNKLLEYLLKYKDIIDNSSVNSPYLHRPRQINFSGPKIVVPQRNTTNKFGYNECEWYSSADVYYITTKNISFSLKYILALLNSKLYYIWLLHKGKNKGHMLELYQQPLSELPIPQISEEKQKPFVEIVDKILEMKKENPNANTTDLEKQIDNMVYDLYGLTKEEIDMVEGK